MMLEKNAKEKTNCHSAKHGSDHPDHTAEIKRLSRVKGQIEGIERMILNRQYCPDIMIQVRAAAAALKSLELALLQGHLRGCVKKAMQSKNNKEVEKKIQEILEILK